MVTENTISAARAKKNITNVGSGGRTFPNQVID
jgi:hypothetical protein